MFLRFKMQLLGHRIVTKNLLQLPKLIELQYCTEADLVGDHLFVSLVDLVKREDFNHWTNTSQSSELQSVFGVNSSTTRPKQYLN